MRLPIHTLWASEKGSGDGACWLIAAEDDTCWEADPDRCERVFAEARAKNAHFEIREVTLHVDWEAVAKTFMPTEIPASTEGADG